MSAPRTPSTVGRPAGSLTNRQREILRLLCEGKVNKEIAAELGIGVGTVKQHVVALFKRLNVRNRAMAVSHGMALLEEESGRGSSGVRPDLVEEGILVRRPCVVLSVALPGDAEPEAARRLHGALAGLAFDAHALFLAREGGAGDLLFGVRRASEQDIVAALQLAVALRDELAGRDPALADALRGGLNAGMAVVSKRRHGGWSGEALASPVIAGARELLHGCAPGELALGPAARSVMTAFALGGGASPPERLPFAALATLFAVPPADEPAPLGREAEWEVLDGALSSAAFGGGRLLLLEGETGMGKSRLCRAAAARAVALGGRAVSLRALPVAGDAPLRDGADGTPLSISLAAERFERESAPAPDLLVVDEFHLLPAAAREALLERAAAAARGGRVVLLAGRRFPADADASEGVERIHLRRLADETVEKLARALAPELAGEALGRRVAESAGVPLFAAELARAGDGAPPLPLLMTVSARLDGFELDWKLLHTLAQGEDPLNLTALADLMGEPPEGVRAAAAAAARVGVLVVEGEAGDERARFHHPLIRRVIETLGLEWGNSS